MQYIFFVSHCVKLIHRFSSWWDQILCSCSFPETSFFNPQNLCSLMTMFSLCLFPLVFVSFFERKYTFFVVWLYALYILFIYFFVYCLATFVIVVTALFPPYQPYFVCIYCAELLLHSSFFLNFWVAIFVLFVYYHMKPLSSRFPQVVSFLFSEHV